MPFTLQMLQTQEPDPDCKAARAADHGFYTVITTEQQLIDCRTALRIYAGVIQRRPRLRKVIQPKIDQLERMILSYTARTLTLTPATPLQLEILEYCDLCGKETHELVPDERALICKDCFGRNTDV